jgi:hypothetical protein
MRSVGGAMRFFPMPGNNIVQNRKMARPTGIEPVFPP